MRLVFLFTPPSSLVMVTCRYHPVPPLLQASSPESPNRHEAPSGSLFSPSSYTHGPSLAWRAVPLLLLVLLLLLWLPGLRP